jgi:DNA-binding PadR family transcriptional regulator
MGRMMRHFARRFPFGPGMGPFGPGMGPRMFGRGDLKYGLLKLLEQRPMHGYEMIKELENLSGGFYTPSAGAIYPTLQLLEDRGWVTVEVVEGKKVYTITDDGRQALAEFQRRDERPGPEHGPGRGPGWGPWGWSEEEHGPEHGRHHRHRERGERFPWEARRELRSLMHEAREVAHLMRAAVIASGGDPEQLAKLQALVERARGELVEFLREQQAQHDAPPSSAPSGSAPSGASATSSADEGTII